MGSRHGHEIDRRAIYAQGSLAVALIVSEAILDADDDPGTDSQRCFHADQLCDVPSYHRFVNTTPNPSATKKSRGEFEGLLLLLLPVPAGAVEVEANGALVDVVVAILYVSSKNRRWRCRVVKRRRRCDLSETGG